MIGDVFGGGRYFLRFLGSAIAFGLMVLGGYIACIIPGIYLALMFFPFTFVLLDEDAPGITCLWRAKEVTENNRLSLFQMTFAMVGIALLGLLMLCVGVIFTAPLAWLIPAVAYLHMTGQPTALER